MSKKSKTITVRIDAELKGKGEMLAKKEGRSLASLIRHLIATENTPAQLLNGAEAKRLDCLLTQTAREAHQVISELSDCQQLFDHQAVSGALNYFEDIANGEKGKRFKGEILPFSM